MKKELFAAALLLLLCLGAALHIRSTAGLTQAVEARLSLSEVALTQGDRPAARNALESAWERWRAAQSYTGSFLSEQVMSDVDEGFFALRSQLMEEDVSAAPAAYERLRFLLEETAERERLSLRTVF